MTQEKRLPRKARKAKANKKPAVQKKLEELTIADVLKTKEYAQKLDVVMKITEIKLSYRRKVVELKQQGKWNVADITRMYAECNNKCLQGYTKSMRDFIIHVGLEAFKDTMILFQKKDA